jgi:hypothetical protein
LGLLSPAKDESSEKAMEASIKGGTLFDPDGGCGAWAAFYVEFHELGKRAAHKAIVRHGEWGHSGAKFLILEESP